MEDTPNAKQKDMPLKHIQNVCYFHAVSWIFYCDCIVISTILFVYQIKHSDLRIWRFILLYIFGNHNIHCTVSTVVLLEL